MHWCESSQSKVILGGHSNHKNERQEQEEILSSNVYEGGELSGNCQ
ncbi:MAG: hypothetical protein ACR5K4_01610 [Sodalis sp. (in: enterobacteria)]